MNERFQELHNQARDFYLQDEYLDVSTKELHRLVEQKFAELIIRECADCVDFYTSDGNGPASDVILNHFGVKE